MIDSKSTSSTGAGKVIGSKSTNKGGITNYDVVGQMMAYEEGKLDDQAVVNLFQNLVDTGMVWSLQGSYQRMANRLIKAGKVHQESKP